MAKRKINWKSKKTWKQVLVIGLAVITIIGAIVGLSALFRKGEETTKVVNPSYAVGGLTNDGKFLETEESIYTKDAFACKGLDVDIAFENNISYEIFFYNANGVFMEKTGTLTDSYSEDIPFFATQCRIVITPNEDDKISWFEKNGYANQLTISVDKEQETKVEEEYSYDIFSLPQQKFYALENEGTFWNSEEITSIVLDVTNIKTIYDNVRIVRNDANGDVYCHFVTSKNLVGDMAIPYCEDTQCFKVSSTLEMEIPTDCVAIVFVANGADGSFMPREVVFYN